MPAGAGASAVAATAAAAAAAAARVLLRAVRPELVTHSGIRPTHARSATSCRRAGRGPTAQTWLLFSDVHQTAMHQVQQSPSDSRHRLCRPHPVAALVEPVKHAFARTPATKNLLPNVAGLAGGGKGGAWASPIPDPCAVRLNY